MYAKIFASLWKGSLHGSGPTWAVFVYLLAHADRDGVVEVVPEAIRDDTGFGLEIVQKAIVELEGPDSRSRSEVEDGRRIVPLDGRGWGWSIVNYERYRNLRDDDERRRQNREAQQRKRARQHPSAAVSPSKPRSAQGEAEGDVEGKAEAEAPATASSKPPLEKKHTPRPRFIPPTLEEVTEYRVVLLAEGITPVEPRRFIDSYQAKGWKIGRNSMQDWRASYRNTQDWDQGKNGHGPSPSRSRQVMEAGLRMKAQERST